MFTEGWTKYSEIEDQFQIRTILLEVGVQMIEKFREEWARWARSWEWEKKHVCPLQSANYSKQN